MRNFIFYCFYIHSYANLSFVPVLMQKVKEINETD